MPSLWPSDIGATSKRAPVDVLREQARFLTETTQGEVGAHVNYLRVPTFTAKTKGEFRFDFDIVAPELNNYSLTLLSIYNSSSLYPVHVEYDGFEGGYATAESEQELSDLLRAVFSSKTTRDLISGIRAQTE